MLLKNGFMICLGEGCKNAIINMEARSIDSKMLTRRCAVAKLQDVTMPKYRDLMTQNAGALLVILPNNLTSLSPEEKQVCKNTRH